MSQLKKAAILKGDVLQDVATGQLFKLHPTKEEMQRGIWEYNSEADDDEDSDDDYDSTTEDEGYSTSPEVDFDKDDYWALGLNSFLWRISLYKESEDEFWTL